MLDIRVVVGVTAAILASAIILVPVSWFVCAWCNRTMGPSKCVDSHGICKECGDTFLENN